MPDTDTERLARVLAGLRFPARRWQLITQSDYYGADSRTRAELARLPERTYPHLAAVAAAIRDNPPPKAAAPAESPPRMLRPARRVRHHTR